MGITLIGVDTGFGFNKAHAGEGVEIVFPAGYKEYDSGHSDFIASSGLEILEYKGEKYLLGDQARRQGATVSHNSEDDLRHILAILYSVIKLNDCEDFNGDIVLGLPSSDRKRKGMLEGFKGKHIAKFNGKEITVEINSVTVVAQGIGCLYDMTLDNEGKTIENYNGKLIGIIDVGEKTSDFVMVNDGQIALDETRSVNHGAGIAKFKFQDFINEEEGITVKFTNLGKYVNKYPTQFQNILEKLTKEIHKQSSRFWTQLGEFDIIFISGGGGSTLFKYFQKYFPSTQLVKDAQVSNARGYYKYGKSLKA